MPIDTDNFTALCQRLAQIDLFGRRAPKPPWGNTPTVAKVRKAIDSGIHSLPLIYQNGYATPLLNHLDTVLVREQGDVEPFAAPVYQHAPTSTVRPPLRRFLAVVSNFYRSFLSKAKRSMLDLPLVTQLPPLAFFQYDGRFGPYTIPAGKGMFDIQTIFPSEAGVVSLPSTYHDDPILWASLAHETGGHDVLHADDDLLPELADGIRSLFGGGLPQPGVTPTDAQFQSVLWSYWVDEAASDVYGLLNIGPEFALNLAAFFAAIGGRQGDPIPSLRTDSGPSAPNDPRLDPHPTDILRLHLAIGVVQNLADLAQATRDSYVADLKSLAALCARGATQVSLQGDIEIDRDRYLQVNLTRPLAIMQEAAVRVGAFIASTKLQSLRNHSIQDIETWDDADELTARGIADALRADTSVDDKGDDAQLLAGATLALLDQVDLYDGVTARLRDALDRSFSHDPIWAPPAPHPMFVPGRLGVRLPPPADKDRAVEAAARSEAKPSGKHGRKSSRGRTRVH